MLDPGKTASNFKQIEYLVTKRCANLEYLKKAHSSSGVLWMNHVRIIPEEIIQFYPADKLAQKIPDYFTLGYSLSPLLFEPPGTPLLKKLIQLMGEYDHYMANKGKKSVSSYMAREKTVSDASTVSITEALKPVLFKTANFGVYYEYLAIPTIPDFLDYNRVVSSLCTVLTQIYKKLIDDQFASVAVLFQAIKDIDSAIKTHFFGQIAKDLTELALSKVKSDFTSFSACMNSQSNRLPPLPPHLTETELIERETSPPPTEENTKEKYGLLLSVAVERKKKQKADSKKQKVKVKAGAAKDDVLNDNEFVMTDTNSQIVDDFDDFEPLDS
ncbi:hypothetical protein BLNAU_645 [Blattamonas nauphoetae]|uniref:Uncharacterized protein n=1 Tax=Blattamonas nauphoetae TaxID=2049346 RepID=A0ABQ9YKL4_9EUKA|nr:hypothetical protein BLNAU_645 [Blattamonas nauphoetae]